VADLNLDNFVMQGPIRDLVAYGAKYSTLDDLFGAAVRRLGIARSDDPLPAMTIFTRSDHYSFMREGVPGLMLFPGKASGPIKPDGSGGQRDYFTHVHHTPLDRIDQVIDWSAGVTFAEANLLIGLSVVNGSRRPAWRGKYFFHDPDRAGGVP
jgi:Zn-dependent M28 family amino/carboxypeptidase